MDKVISTRDTGYSTISIVKFDRVIFWPDFRMDLGWQKVSNRDFDIVWMSTVSKVRCAWILGWKGYSFPDWFTYAIEDPTNLFYQRPALQQNIRHLNMNSNTG